MRKVKLQMQLSVDGFVAGPNGEMDWMVWDWDDALKQYVRELTEPVDCILLGRVLATGFIPHWEAAAAQPDSDESGAKKFAETPKIVFSKTLSNHDWPNATLATGDLAEEVSRLKALPGSDIMVYGGGNFVSNLIKQGLVDEYHFFINPSILGSGMPIFKGVDYRYGLKLQKATAFECGIVVLTYTP